MSTTERAVPPMNADERSTLTGWLDFYRASLVAKCDGIDEQQARTASVPPSELTLVGLVGHVTEVERNWFRRVLTGEDVPPVHDAPSRTQGHDGGFDLPADVTLDDALGAWRREVDLARARCTDRALDATSPLGDGEVTLRWIYAHMIAEYARHCGHADLVRERIDGATGV